MKTVILTSLLVLAITSAYAFDPAKMNLPPKPQPSAQQAALEKKVAELKPSMPGKTPYEVCMAALATMPAMPNIPGQQRPGCNGYEGSPLLKAAAERAAAEKAAAARRATATPVVKPR